MEFTAKGRLIAVCNWTIACIGAAISVYVFAFIFSVPPDAESDQIISASGSVSAPAANPTQPINSQTSANPSGKPVLRPNTLAGNGSASAKSAAPAAQNQQNRPTQTFPQTLPPGAGPGF